MTKQPEWECIANLGDVNPIDHGGKFVLVDRTGVYPPEMEVVEELACNPGHWRVWRFSMDRCTYINGVLSDNPYHPAHAAWFADDIRSVAETFSEEPDDLIGYLCSDDPLERARGYECLLGYYGAAEFDSYPVEFVREEVEERYAAAPYNVEV